MVMGWSLVRNRVHCCAGGGLDKKVSQVSVGRRKDKAPDEICDASLIQCIPGLRRALGEKGNDTNYESEGELRSTTSISAKHPFKTVLDILPLAVSFSDVKYFIYRARNRGWCNCRRF